MPQPTRPHQPAYTDLPRWAVLLVFLLFFLSGAAGLVYEVIWTRVLLTVFGATIYAVSTVLASFMGGLALGSLVGGRVADRLARPLRAYGVVELVAAATAVVVPVALDLFDPLYRALYASGEVSFTGLSLVRFALCFVTLLVPTTCLGATLPLLSRFLTRSGDSLGSRIGGLYAVNTAGAVTGTFLAGFVLIAALGVWGTIMAAAVTSCVVGVVALLAAGRLEGPAGAPAGADPLSLSTEGSAVRASTQTRGFVLLVLATYGVAGFLALAFQVLWTRTLVFRFDILKNTTYAFSAMLTVFLVGLACGSAAMAAMADRQRNPARLYGLIQILTGVSGALSLFVLVRAAGGIEVAPALNQGGFSWGIAVTNVFVRTGATIFLPTFLMGAAFPLAARLTVRRLSAVGRGTGTLYAANTVGAILGSFAAGFVIIPHLGLARAMPIAGAAYVTLGTLVLVANSQETPLLRALWGGLGAATILALVATSPGQAPFQVIQPGHHLVADEAGGPAYIEGPLATVAVLESSIGDRTIYIDNVAVAGTDRILLTDQKSLAHIPMFLLERPRSALTVGFGSGGASWSFLVYPELERVDCVEISPSVPRLAHTLRASNHGLLDGWDGRSDLSAQSFHDGRYRVILDDARSLLRLTDTRWDIIATDCTDLRYKSNANLYDVEYFELCRQAITDDGMVVVWMPLGGMSEEVFACAMRTFAHVFPDMTVWYMSNEPTHYLLLLGTRQPLEINIARVLERSARPAVRRDLGEVSLEQPEKILSCFLTDGPSLENWLDSVGTALNTENTPFLEFESPKYGLGDEPVLTNLDVLTRHRSALGPYLVDADEHPDFMDRLSRFAAATDPILRGHAQLRRLQLVEAASSYLEAQRICPADHSVEFLLRFSDLQRRIAAYPNDAWSRLELALIALVRNDVEVAGQRFYEVVNLTVRRNDPQGREWAARAILGLAECFLRIGQPDRGLRLLLTHSNRLAGMAEVSRLENRLRAAAAEP